jgi:2',3'-cyclic-nucleotide 2'-phosphodiesterase (5'-nucleotidase family)
MTIEDVHWSFLPTGSVTVTNLYGLIDQDVYIYSVRLTGQQLKDILEVSINSSSNSNSTDFLQVSRKSGK